jgi:uncharacterized membrane protein HdeD (DUF308 family)
MAKQKNSEIYSALLYIIVGALLVIFRSETLGWAMTFAGVFFIISGILDITKNNMAGGAVSIIIGIVILILGWTVAKIVLLVLGIMIAIKGIIALCRVLMQKRTNLAMILYPSFSIIIGFMLAFGNGLDVIIVIVGALLISDGVLGLFNSAKK